LPIAVSPTPAVLPIPQTSSRSRPAGIDLPIQPTVPGIDSFHPPTPASLPMVPLAVPAPPMAPPELAAPVTASLDPAVWGLDVDASPQSGRRRGADETDLEQRVKRAPGKQTLPLSARLLGRGRTGAARLLVLALVVGAEGVAVTTMSGHARTAPADPSTSGITGAFELSNAKTQLSATGVLDKTAVKPAVADHSAADALAAAQALEAKQQESSNAKVTAALAQARAAAARVKAAADRKAAVLSNARNNPQAVAKVMMIDRGWGSSQFSCLVSLWNRESGWNYQATNASSGAYGIPQALPGSKMASAGSDWRTNPVTQIRWGLDYISDRYGTPCGAWGHSEATGWY
jgi:hypothetical protein